MGQHKHNPTVKLAKEGKLPPKKRPMSKKKVRATIMAELYNRVILPDVPSYWKGR